MRCIEDAILTTLLVVLRTFMLDDYFHVVIVYIICAIYLMH